MNLNQKPKSPSRWREFALEGIQRAEALTRRLCGNGVVAIAPLLSAVNALVEFRPLAMLGALAHDGNRFIIYICCRPSQAAGFKHILQSDGGIGLPTRVRFTIAHEVAHTFFFRLSDGVPISLVDMDRHAELKRLEALCDDLAGRLLIPDDLLRGISAVRINEFISPEVVAESACRLRVSAQAFVVRLDSCLSSLSHADGLIAHVTSGGTITATALTKSAEILVKRASNWHRGRPMALRELCDCEGLRAFGGSSLVVNSQLSGVDAQDRRWVRQVEMSCAPAKVEHEWVVTMKLLPLR